MPTVCSHRDVANGLPCSAGGVTGRAIPQAPPDISSVPRVWGPEFWGRSSKW